MPLKLLAVGDIHLGRYPSRLPEALSGERRALAPAAAWKRVVDHAVADAVDVVALAGDVVEREDDFFEAYRELHRGVQRLTEAGIRVLGVAGNHDVKVLPRLADQLPDFHLLGRGGEWESTTLEAGGESLTLHGWSFPSAVVRRSPLEGVHLERCPGLNIGLLHCDRDQHGSPHAPVRSSELDGAGLDGWLLGHIHAPDALSSDRLSGYLGCVSGMDPGEPGDHGPWLISVESGRLQSVEQRVLAPMRWQAVTLDLSELEEAEQARSLLLEYLRGLDEELSGRTMAPAAVGVRLSLAGRTGFGPAVQRLFEREKQEGSIVHDGVASGAAYFIEHCQRDTRPTVSLDSLAGQSDPPGLLAQRLRWLERPDSEPARRLIRDARQRLRQQAADARWRGLDVTEPDDEEVIDHLRRTGTRLLDEMLSRQGGEP
ncbi:MAG: metallophosphoesterase [Pseudohongiellaceae bacterium]